MSPSVSSEIISPQRAGESTAVSSRWRTGQIVLCVLLALFAAWYATVGWRSPLGDSGKADNFSVVDLAGFVVAGALVWLTTPTAWTIAATTFQEAIRRKWLTLLLGFALVMLAVSTFFTWMQPGSEQKFLRDFGVGFTVIMMLIVSVFLGIALIPPEIERRTIFTILSKPVNRVEFLLGKYYGLCLVILVNLALMTLMFLIAYAAFVIRQEHGLKAALQATGAGVSPRGLVFDLVNLTKDLALQFGLGAVMGALALLLSQVMSNIISIIFSFIVYFLGQSASYWEHLADKNATLGPALSPPVRDVVNFVYFFLPRLDRFDVRERLINDLPVGFNYIVKAGSSSLVYIAVLLALAYFVFGDREFLGHIMENNKWAFLGCAAVLLVAYNLTQPGLRQLRENKNMYPHTEGLREAYGPSMEWLDRLANSAKAGPQFSVDPRTNAMDLSKSGHVKLDFSVLSSLMVAGLASGFKSQVANLLWMKSDEYWHEGLYTRQVPLMEAVVTLDPQFIDAWSTAGWHWAYNIYADIPTNPTYKARGPREIRVMQQHALDTGIDYLKRGANMNPDKYRLWFEWGWTRAEKAGYKDDETLALYKIARSKPDARDMERQVQNAKGETVTETVQGIDLMGRTIGHLLESIPDFTKAENWYGGELLKLKPNSPERKLLDDCGDYWAKYGSDYPLIVTEYKKAGPAEKAGIKALIPDIDHMVVAQAMREKLAAQPSDDQPVGAYVSIWARYIPAVRLANAGDQDGAIAYIVGLMNADPKYCLKGLPIFAKVLELRGDSPTAIQAHLQAVRDAEKSSSQDLGLHFLATLYEHAAAKVKNTDHAKFMAYNRLAYETWYRSRERDALDFYALRNTRKYEDAYGFKAPQKIIEAVKNSRKSGVPNAAPPVPPNMADYYKA